MAHHFTAMVSFGTYVNVSAQQQIRQRSQDLPGSFLSAVANCQHMKRAWWGDNDIHMSTMRNCYANIWVSVSLGSRLGHAVYD